MCDSGISMDGNQAGNQSVRPLIGVFWDIENCSVPSGKSALAVVKKIRERLFKGYREAEFMCVCDVNKENRDVIQELNDAQVTVVHINATSKNAADDKLRQSLRRFGNTHRPPATVVLISGDVNFASELSDLRHRHNLTIILLHKHNVQDALIACAHEHFSFDELVGKLPERIVQRKNTTELIVSNLPKREMSALRSRLKMLSDNCGGRVLSINGTSAVVRFPNADAADRAKKRMDGEFVYENQITVNYSDAPDVKPKVMKVKPEKSCQETVQLNTNPPLTSKLTMNPSPSSSPKGHSSPKPEHMSRGCQYPYNKKILNGRDDKSINSSTKDFQCRRRFSPGGDGRKPCNISPQLKVLPRKHSDGSRYGPIISHSGNSPSFKLFPSPQSASCKVNAQSCVDKLSKDCKPSRDVLFLQQQLYQEEQEKRVKSTDSQDSWESASVCSCPSMRDSPVFSDIAPHRCHSTGPEYQSRRWGDGHYSRYRQNLNRSFASESFFRPIDTSSMYEVCEPGLVVPLFGVELIVSNLDYNISGREWKKIIQSTFQQQVQILSINVQPQPDNTSIAFVTVPSVDEARFAISQLHRKKIGYKRIHVALKPTDPKCAATNTRYAVVALLRNVADNSLPLFKFIELFEKRYHRNISVSELYKMRDIVDIHEQAGSGRMVTLTTAGKRSPVPQLCSDFEAPSIIESPVCSLHCPEGSENYVVSMEMTLLPNVVIPLRQLAAQVHTLLLGHDGSMPLMSFPCCYAVEFPALQETNEGSVSLEHLLSCIPGVNIELSHGGVKKVKLSEKRTPSVDMLRNCPSPIMSYHLTQFSREIVDMLKSCPSAILTFNKFIPFYHHHFGRQCRVADYGYTKLSELFEALPHVLQVLGCGNQKLLTLTHRIQTKRFQTDLLRVLKGQPIKQIAVSLLPQAFEKVNGRPLHMPDYGVCVLDDMIHDLPDSVLAVVSAPDDTILALPRHDQTPEEIERTRTFAAEVVELLKHSRQCRMPFNKFVPAYHHHFGRQCKVSDYGFTKLMELFEAIPDIVKIVDELDDKVICLTDGELFKVFGEQTTAMLKSHVHHSVPLQYFLQEFMRFHGYCIKLQDFGVLSLEMLLKKINYVVKVENVQGHQMVSLVDRSVVQRLAYRVVDILINQPAGDMRIPEFKSKFVELYKEMCSMESVRAEMMEVVEIHGNILTGTIKLCPLQMFARSIRSLLQSNQNKLPLQNFASVYQQHFGIELNSLHYGYPTNTSLLQAISHMVTIRGRGQRRTVLLNQDFLNRLSVQVAYKSLPTRILCGPIDAERNFTSPSNDSGILDEDKDDVDDDTELVMINSSPCDLLSDRVPSSVPSPALEPAVVEQDLIQLSTAVPAFDILNSLSLEEKKVLQLPLCQTPTSEMLQFAAQLLPPMPSVGQQESPEHQAFKDKIQELQNLLSSSPEEQSPSKTPKKCRIAAKFSMPLGTPRNA